MTIRLLAFGIARDILGGAETTIDLPDDATVETLRAQLYAAYPELTKLRSLAIARNNQYANENEVITAQDEVVLIPPVSGG
mgnify:CR=1 FL=1